MRQSFALHPASRLLFLLFIGLMYTPFAATRINILWIGNSLTTAPWCPGGDEGWLAVQDYADTTTNQTGIQIACQPVMLGATSLATHWSLGSGTAEMNNPVVRNPVDRFQTIAVDHYDYLVMQVYSIGTGVTLAAESTAVVNYSNLALSKGIKPVLYQCWVNHPEDYSGAKIAWDSCYAHFKSKGMLIAPLMDMHHAINAEKPVTYLYQPGDAYLHPSQNGVFLTVSTFVYLFTKVKPSAFNLNLMAPCAANSGLPAEQAYLATKAEAALSVFYNLGSTATAGLRRTETVGRNGIYPCKGRLLVGSHGVVVEGSTRGVPRLCDFRGAKLVVGR